MATQWISLIAGLWIILSAYVGFTAGGMAVNLTVTGVIVAALALLGVLQYHNVETRRTFPQM